MPHCFVLTFTQVLKAIDTSACAGLDMERS